MASACALAINRGKIIYISRLSHSAECDKRIFTEGVVKKNRKCSRRKVVSGWDLSREKVVQKHPQVFLNHKLKRILPLKMARAQAEAISNRLCPKAAAAQNLCGAPLFYLPAVILPKYALSDCAMCTN